MNGRPVKTSIQPGVRFLVPVLSLLFYGCGAPGEPQPLSPPVPTAITDLGAHQQGNGVQLVFTLPSHTTTSQRLAQPPAAEIFRGLLKPDGQPDNRSFRLVYTIPGALAHDYAADGKIQFTDPIAADELRAHAGTTLAYRVRTRAAKEKDSADSNTVTVTVLPLPDKIPSVDSKVTQNDIELSWPVPELQANGETITGYHVYRGELDPTAAIPPASELAQAKWASPPVLLAETQSDSYNDKLVEFGKTYVYWVRSVTLAGGNAIESDDSGPAIVAPRDTFPPAVPQNLAAAVLPGPDGGRLVDLSWSINLETDLAGYRVYRSEKEGERGQSLQAELVVSPAFRDASVQPGKQYWYSVTAVDRAGNESAASEPALADLTQPLP